MDIPQELPRRRDDDSRYAGRSEERTVSRGVPDNPILRRLQSLQERAADHRLHHPPMRRKNREQTKEAPVNAVSLYPLPIRDIPYHGAQREQRATSSGLGCAQKKKSFSARLAAFASSAPRISARRSTTATHNFLLTI